MMTEIRWIKLKTIILNFIWINNYLRGITIEKDKRSKCFEPLTGAHLQQNPCFLSKGFLFGYVAFK
jgi:hypothetical protein